MRSIIAIILSAFVVQAQANEAQATSESSDEELTMDKMVELLNDKDTMDMLVEKLSDKLFGPAMIAAPAPRVATLPYQPVEMTRPLMRDASISGRFGSALGVAPPIMDVGYERPKSLDPTTKTKPATEKVWGNPYGDGGSTPKLPYGDKFPSVGDSFPRDKEINTPTKQTFYVPGSKDALFGNDRYELLKNGIKAEVTESFDISKEYRAQKGTFALKKNPNQLYEEPIAETNVISLSAVALISLVIGSGLTLAVFRSRRSALAIDKEPLLWA